MTNYDPLAPFRLRQADIRERRRLARIPKALRFLFPRPALWPWVERTRALWRRKD